MWGMTSMLVRNSSCGREGFRGGGGGGARVCFRGEGALVRGGVKREASKAVLFVLVGLSSGGGGGGGVGSVMGLLCICEPVGRAISPRVDLESALARCEVGFWISETWNDGST